MPRQSGDLPLPEPTPSWSRRPCSGRYAPVWNQTRSNHVFSRHTPSTFLLQYSPTYTVSFYPSLCRAPFPRCCSSTGPIPAPAGVLATVIEAHRHLLAVLRFAGKGADVHTIERGHILASGGHRCERRDGLTGNMLLVPVCAQAQLPSLQKNSPPQIWPLPLFLRSQE